MAGADNDLDGVLAFQEILDNHELFVGSEVMRIFILVIAIQFNLKSNSTFAIIISYCFIHRQDFIQCVSLGPRNESYYRHYDLVNFKS